MERHPTNDPPEKEHRAPRDAGLVALIVGAGCALRLLGTDVHSLWFDETMTLAAAHSADLVETLKSDRQPPLAILLFRAWIALVGEEAARVRLLPALVGCGSLLLFARLARSCCPGRLRLVALALFALSPFSIWFSQELRAYFLLELCALICLVALQRAISEPAHSARAALLVLCACAAAFGAHYMGALLVFTVSAIALTAKLRGHIAGRQAGLLIGAAGAGCTLWSPWWWIVTREQLANPWGFTARLSARDLAELPLRFFIVEADALPLQARFIGYLLGAALLIAFAAGVWRALRHPRAEAVFALAAFFAPVLGALLLALVSYPNFAPRYLMVAEPGAVLLVAWGACSVPGRIARVGLATAILAGCAGLALVHKTSNHKEDFRSACAEVIAHWRPGDRVCSITGTIEGLSEAPLLHYLRNRPDVLQSLVHERPLASGRAQLLPGTRVHVVYREAPYAVGYLEGVEARSRVEHAGPNRFRVQYVRVAMN
jgi:mannosyltransferase